MSKAVSQGDALLMPHDLGAEGAVVCCCLLEPRVAIPKAMEFLKGQMEVFYDGRHGVLFAAMARMVEEGRGVDLVTVAAELGIGGGVGDAGSGDPAYKGQGVTMDFLIGVADLVPSAGNLEDYLEVVRDKWLLRRVIRLGHAAMEAARSGQAVVADVLDSFEKEVLALGESRFSTKEATMKDLMPMVVERLENYHRGHGQLLGLSTGFEYLDKMTCGFIPQELWVIGARPSTGKTSMGWLFCDHLSVNLKVATAFFSLEMSNLQLAERGVFMRAHGDYQRFRTGFMRNEDGQPLIAAVGKLSGAPMFIDDTPGITLMELRAKLRRLVRVHNVRVAVVDYFGLMGVPDVRHKREFLEEISKGMKMLAKELRITLVCLAQLNRESEREKSRKPQMADLRDCGSLEQDADLVGLLYEPRMDGDEEEQMAAQHGNDWSQVSRRINLLVAKQRNGPTGDCQFLFKKSCMRFEEYRRSEASAKYDKRAAPKEGKRQVVDLDL